jgi:hypothetical protein
MGVNPPILQTGIDNGNAMIDALPYPVAVRTLKRAVKDGVVNPTARMEYTVEREDYDNKRILFFGRKSDKF